MGCVGDEAPLALERGLEPAEHLVEGLGQLAELVAGAAQRDPGQTVVLGCGAGGGGDLLHRAQGPSGRDPAEDRRERDDQGQREERVLQQVREDEGALVLGALELDVGEAALGEDRGGEEGMRTARRRRPGGDAAGAGARGCALPREPHLRHQGVAGGQDDRAAQGEQARVQEGQTPRTVRRGRGLMAGTPCPRRFRSAAGRRGCAAAGTSPPGRCC